ncbi:uncharacterized protein LOC108451147 [Gossypium arboreum]|uniref:uncharacterized protein LOC108451147 n=1 Tax=Gossypium arboreum TaxID=29729 RepID=UPI0008196939|nr:uncharacterized protein LOC108451147 [Gossypium arboreum]
MMVPKSLCDEIERIVRKFVWGSTNGDSSWNLDIFQLWVSEEIINKIVGIPPSHPSLGPNKIVWGATSTNLFSLKSAYEKIRDGTLNPKEHIWEMPWRFNGPQRIYFFLWLAFKRHLLTNSEMTMRGIGNSSACGFCGLRMCYMYSEIALLLESFGTNLFQKKDYPNSNWVSLRTDGLVRLDEGFAAAGSFVSDHNGGWIMGFCRYLGNCTMVEAELWGILDGLNLILDRRFERLLIQTDIIEVVNAIQESSSRNSNFAIFRRFHLILKMVKQWRIQHIPREENLVVDTLAKSVRSRRLGLRLVKDLPMRI